MIKSLKYLVLCVNDLDKMLNFYADLLGCSIKNRFETDNSNAELKKATGLTDLRAKGVELATNSDVDIVLLEYHQKMEKNEKAAFVNFPGYRQIAFTVDNIEDTYNKLKKAGIKFFSEPVTVGHAPDSSYRFVKLTDPEGNIIELEQF